MLRIAEDQTVSSNASGVHPPANHVYARTRRKSVGHYSDFKVFDLDEQRRHAKYDIRRCFDIGWDAGFRGPWAIEHWNEATKAFVREIVYLSETLKQWMADAA